MRMGRAQGHAAQFFGGGAAPAEAQAFFERFVTLLREAGAPVETGVFGAHMVVRVENDGPVTMVLEVE